MSVWIDSLKLMLQWTQLQTVNNRLCLKFLQEQLCKNICISYYKDDSFFYLNNENFKQQEMAFGNQNGTSEVLEVS